MKITHKEKRVIEGLKNLLDPCEGYGYSNIDYATLALDIGITVNELKGVASSLIKKDVVWSQSIGGSAGDIELIGLVADVDDTYWVIDRMEVEGE